ncbi:hypothetical protein O7607_27530 [Micromonospora sp. WMMA1949]|uniref:hypothetical protein n=1 Tax=unclassified Micromonospora TaxID=2617518 RepID=UPI0022B613EF|nr:hypothetical protein [Micromonospora sp. WMMA1949]MCZ7429516.1 hypothetical protein [Micromonospora sp. WMMA1949]
MRPDEFRHALSLLPAPLHTHALLLGRCAFHTACPACQRVGDAVTLALTAAHYGRVAAAGHLLDNAVRLAEEHGTIRPPQPDPSPGHGLPVPWTAVPAPVVAAAGVKRRRRTGGIGYASGRWTRRITSRGPSPAAVRRRAAAPR